MRRFTPMAVLLLLVVLSLTAVPAHGETITSRLYGGFGYLDLDGTHHPTASMRFEVWRPEYGIGGLYVEDAVLVATGNTDANGDFDLNVTWDYTVAAYPFTSRSTLIIKMFAESADHDVKISEPGVYEAYHWTLYPSWNTDRTLGIFGDNTPPTEDGQFMAHLYAQTQDARTLVAANWGDVIRDVRISYPDPFAPTGGGYGQFGGISLPAYSQWRDDHLFRLLGHRWNDQFSGRETYDLCDGTCDDTATICSFCDWCEENETAAWNEGFALFFADRVTGWMAATGEPSLQAHGFQSLDACGGTTFGDPQLTPGYTAALLLDLVDAVEVGDDHPEYPGFHDAVGNQEFALLDVMRQDDPTSTIDFLYKLQDRYTLLRYAVWETAMNCGFDTDIMPPNVIFDHHSPSHPVNGYSTDNTVDFTWTAAWDDASGIQGYAIEMAAITRRPAEVLTVGDVESWTSDFLAPGTWYMNILAQDRAGNWSPLASSYGPVFIEATDELDLVYQVRANWDYVSFPSQGIDNSASEAHVTPILVGNEPITRYNLAGENLGPADAVNPVYLHVVVDGETVADTGYMTSVPVGGYFPLTNSDSFNVRGGRHNFYTIIDGRGDNPETDELNNFHGRQFVWTGAVLAPNVPVTRAAPPEVWAGADHTTGATWYVSDGLNFPSTSWWSAVAVRPVSDGDNYDCRLHVTSTGSENGFTANLGYSTRPAGSLDAVIVNRNLAGSATWDVGVLNPGGGTGDYRAVLEQATSFAFGDSLTFSLAPERLLMLHEVYVAPADTGRVSVTVDIGTAPDPVTVLWLDKTFQTGNLLDFAANAVTGIDGRARLDLQVPTSGYYCVVLYRDGGQITAAADLVMEVGPTPADLAPYHAAGWYAPMVPRPTDDATVSSVAVPDSLPGNVNATYFSIASINQGYLDAVPAHIGAELDGVSLFGITYPSMPAGAVYRTNNHNPFTVRGGRHTIALVADSADWIEEVDETNNTYGLQYVWSPLVVPLGNRVFRLPPPDRVGGWNEAPAMWYNCDGLRLPAATGDSYWTAAAIMPSEADDDPDIRLHEMTTGVQDGFANNRASSHWGPGQSDYVLTNGNLGGRRAYDVGVIRGSGGVTTTYMAETVASTYMGVPASGTVGPYSIDADQILDIYEWSGGGGILHIVLENVLGNVDWGLSVHVLDEPHMSKSDVIAGGSAWLNGPGENEYLTVEIPAAGYFCVAVWKRGVADLELDGEYQLRINTAVSGVADEVVPRITRLVGAAPNPFNPQTTINYELAKPGRVGLAIYDLTGARVADLVNTTVMAGRHRVVWSGLDNADRQVASGVYMAWLTVDGRAAGMTKLSLVK